MNKISVLIPLLLAVSFSALPSNAQFEGEVSTGAKHFQSDSATVSQGGVPDVPGLIGLAAVAEQYDDQNKADRYYAKAQAALDAVDHIEGERVIATLKRFDRLIEDDQSPAAKSLHMRVLQLVNLGPQTNRAKLTIGPETDTVQHDEPAATMIRRAQMAFQQRNLPVANEQLHNAFDFESHMRTTVKSDENDVFHLCMKADTAYKLAVVNYYQGDYTHSLNYVSHVVDTYDNAYGPASQASLRAHYAFNVIKAATERANQQATQDQSGL